MSIIKNRYLTLIANFNQKQLILEARYLGIYINTKSKREVILDRLNQIGDQVISKRLSDLQTKQLKNKTNFVMRPTQKCIIRPFISKQTQEMQQWIRKINHQAHLGLALKFEIKQIVKPQTYIIEKELEEINIQKLLIEQEITKTDKSDKKVQILEDYTINPFNKLFRVEEEIVLPPTAGTKQYNKSKNQLLNEIVMNQNYKLPKMVLPGVRQSLTKRKDPVSDMLTLYGMRKEQEFMKMSVDPLQSLIFKKPTTKQTSSLVRQFIKLLPVRRSYYQKIMQNLDIIQLHRIATVLRQQLLQFNYSAVKLFGVFLSIMGLMKDNKQLLQMSESSWPQEIENIEVYNWLLIGLWQFYNFLNSAELDDVRQGLELMLALREWTNLKQHLRQVLYEQDSKQFKEWMYKALKSEYVKKYKQPLQDVIDTINRDIPQRVPQKIQEIIENLPNNQTSQTEYEQLRFLKLTFNFFAVNNISISTNPLSTLIDKLNPFIEQAQQIQKGSVMVTKIAAEVDQQFINDIILVVFSNDRSSAVGSKLLSFLWNRNVENIEYAKKVDYQSVKSLLLLGNIIKNYEMGGTILAADKLVELQIILRSCIDYIYENNDERSQSLQAAEIIEFIKTDLLRYLPEAAEKSLLLKLEQYRSSQL